MIPAESSAAHFPPERTWEYLADRTIGVAAIPMGRRVMVDPNITDLLKAAAGGDRRDVDALMDAIYQDLRRMAEHQLQVERRDHTLQPTALVHEAYLKLIDQRQTNWQDRAHFFAIAARVIRRILVDHARQRGALKRGGNRQRMALEDVEPTASSRELDLVALDAALGELAVLDPRQSQIIEMRFFGGLTLEEIAKALDVGRRTIDREWAAARAWLFVRLAGDTGDPSDG